ncbi:hypothetical protein [Flavobacterium anhuiense]|uniref:hypothetical protein n=1 Tax=Flavobacterium anhuiense TaxID=459526 RepID=UPI001183DA23|nr:hypothetical protein [Flavobacterium anhuiense]
MEKTIRLRVRKDTVPSEHTSIIRLKGSLVSKGYTQIIHIEDQDEQFHINTFEIPEEKTGEVLDYIASFIAGEQLLETITITK